ncbi:sex-determining region Y protein-like isoform X3 [Hippocampus comes]|uniref:sex-determining region Y protein-like isoform X3 n=1 Tax=Hippocampus comes TaxID=109280 RepID=UPI00094E2D3F|nr:PREDICTED: sex-determining region Y protein-like isoform X3 [Hippocampus comes]
MEQLRAEFEKVVAELKWEEVVSTLLEVVSGMVCATASCPPPVPSWLRFDTHCQLVTGHNRGYGGCVPPSSAFVQAGQVMAGPQTNPYGMHAFDIKSQAGGSQNLSLPGRSLPENSNWCPPGMLNGGDMFPMSGPSVYAAPMSSNSKRKRRRRRIRDADQPYVKKPPNAFMCFLKEQRQHVKAQMNLKDSASVNTVLGHMWKLLTDEGQAKYYKIADAEKKLHSQMYPEWSSSDNYGNKRRRRSVTTASNIAEPGSPGETPTPQTSDESEKMRIADKVLHMLGCA